MIFILHFKCRFKTALEQCFQFSFLSCYSITNYSSFSRCHVHVLNKQTVCDLICATLPQLGEIHNKWQFFFPTAQFIAWLPSEPDSKLNKSTPCSDSNDFSLNHDTEIYTNLLTSLKKPLQCHHSCSVKIYWKTRWNKITSLHWPPLIPNNGAQQTHTRTHRVTQDQNTSLASLLLETVPV